MNKDDNLIEIPLLGVNLLQPSFTASATTVASAEL